jgi:O-methyltransferase involved in polyketide biosynthesis
VVFDFDWDTLVIDRMSTIQDVSGTAFVVAEYRAEEDQEPIAIYQDPVDG